MPDFQNLDQLESLARSRLEPMAFDYIAGGSESEAALRENRAAFERYRFRPRVLHDVSQVSLETTILGTKIRMPVLLAPTGFHKLVHPEGEVATARGAADAGTIFCASTIANCSVEEIAEGAVGPKWFQLYVFRDRELTEGLVRRAKNAGYSALVFTVDVPALGRRERDIRNAWHLPAGIGMGNFDVGELSRRGAQGSSLAAFIASQFDASLTWESIRWLKKVSGLPVMVKGVLAGEDAALAVKHGADGVIVSNHGGRQLDHSVASLDALPEVVVAVKGRCEVLMDGGVRRGTDVLKAICLGARAVLIGRPAIWGLALGGREGVRTVLEHLQMEIETSLKILGAARLEDLGPSYLSRLDDGPSPLK